MVRSDRRRPRTSLGVRPLAPDRRGKLSLACWVTIRIRPITTVVGFTVSLLSLLSPWSVSAQVGALDSAFRVKARAQAALTLGTPDGERTSVRLYLEAATLFAQAKNQQQAATALYDVAVVYDMLAEEDSALSYAQRALQTQRRINDRDGESWTLLQFAFVYQHDDLPDVALRFAQEAVTNFVELGDRWGEGRARSVLGWVNLEGRDFDSGERQVRLAAPLLHDTQHLGDEGRDWMNLGVAYALRGNSDSALSIAHRALNLAQQAGDSDLQASIMATTAVVHKHLGQRDSALAYFCQALHLRIARTPQGDSDAIERLHVQVSGLSPDGACH